MKTNGRKARKSLLSGLSYAHRVKNHQMGRTALVYLPTLRFREKRYPEAATLLGCFYRQTEIAGWSERDSNLDEIAPQLMKILGQTRFDACVAEGKAMNLGRSDRLLPQRCLLET